MDLPPPILSIFNATGNNYTYSIEPDPIYSHQSWVSKFENIRRFEHDERERELRRDREHSNDGLIEALIVVAIIAMIVIPFMIWLYYKSGICDPNRERLKSPGEQGRRRYSRGVLIQRPTGELYTPIVDGMNFVPPLKPGSGLKCPKPTCVCSVENEKQSSKKNMHRNMKENAPYAPTPIAKI